MMIKGKYKIEVCNVTQFKNLISHDSFINDIKPKMNLAYEKELELGRGNIETVNIKNELKETYGSEWFTDKSPLFESISSGLLCLIHGSYECKMIKL